MAEVLNLVDIDAEVVECRNEQYKEASKLQLVPPVYQRVYQLRRQSKNKERVHEHLDCLRAVVESGVEAY